MPHTNITTRIMQSRINGLVAENAALKSEIAALQGIAPAQIKVKPEVFADLLDNMAAEDEANGIFDHREPDYGLGGGEWIDPTTGADTWHS